MEVNGAKQLFGSNPSSKYLQLCSADERNSYRFATTWGWVNDGRIFIFGWSIPLIDNVLRAKGTENGKQNWIDLGELSSEEVNDDVYLLPRPLGPCPVDRPLAIGTKLRWQTHRQTNKKQKCQTEHRNGEADKMIWCVTTKTKVQTDSVRVILQSALFLKRVFEVNSLEVMSSDGLFLLVVSIYMCWQYLSELRGCF